MWFPLEWQGIGGLDAKSYTCGYCENRVLSKEGYWATDVRWEPSFDDNDPPVIASIYICHACNRPTFIFEGLQVPGGLYGNSVDSLPEDVANLYEEARRCMGVSAFTAVAMTCRKLLMNVAVSLGAEENQSYAKFVNYLAERGYIPADEHDWVDWIRTRGNVANHEIEHISDADAGKLLFFVEILLKLAFELPGQAAAG